MESLENIGTQLSNLTVYDLKSYYSKAKGVILNLTEYEQKVREATSNDPWGASSTLMQEIASASHNFQLFNEIMPTIYRRFTDKEASEWRQIYKSLQLLEYLIKHGSERVVDDARSHISTIKMLRNFHYVDDKGKDQGINVRNRAKELAELLSDLERVRAERRKAKQTRNKYTGVSSDSLRYGSGSSGQYGGFGNESAYPGASYGGGEGGRSSGFHDEDSRNAAYDEYDEDVTVSSTRSKQSTKAESAKPKEPEVDLFSFGDDEPAIAAAPSAAAAPKRASGGLDDDWGTFASGNGADTADADDFDDFQSAPSATPAVPTVKYNASAPLAATSNIPALKPAVASNGGANLFDILGGSTPAAAPKPAPTMPIMGSGLGGFTGLQSSTTSSPFMSPSITPQSKPSPSTFTSKGSAAADFSDLWSVAATGNASKSNASASTGKVSMNALAAQKSSSAIWGATPQQQQNIFGQPKPANATSNNDDLLL